MNTLMSNMINLDYICFLRRIDNFKLFALNDLSIENSHHHYNYLQVIPQFRLNFQRDPSRLPDAEMIEEITDEDQKGYLLDSIQPKPLNNKSSKQRDKDVPYFEDMENLLCGVPQTIKLSNKGKTNYYYFIIGKCSVLMCVSDEFDSNLRENLIQLNRRFESLFSEEQINSTNEILFSDAILFTFTDILTTKLLNRYYIPHLPRNSVLRSTQSHFSTNGDLTHSNKITAEITHFIDYLSKNNKKLKSSQFDRLTNEIDGISNIEAIADNMQIDITELAKVLLYLWLKNYMIFRIPIFNWNIFERTHKSNDYLLDGSDSQKYLLELYGGGKIISLLSRFDGRSNVSEIQKKMNINDLRFMRYVYDLYDMELIQKSEKFPVLRHIGQEIVPLLVIQGLQQKDLKIIEELEARFDGSKSITSVALKMDESPQKIKQILDKIPEFVQYNSI
jgi:hypothetical protein